MSFADKVYLLLGGGASPDVAICSCTAAGIWSEMAVTGVIPFAFLRCVEAMLTSFADRMKVSVMRMPRPRPAPANPEGIVSEGLVGVC